MAESHKHMATCACGAVGDVVEQSGRFDLEDPWWVIAHEGGDKHRNVRVKVDGNFRFKRGE